jgi:hypothetical protein
VAGTLTIPRRFNGPPDSGNGGYSCGLVASFLEEAEAVEVSLRAPPPLERALAAEVSESTAIVRDGETVVAQAQASAVDLEVPDPVGLKEAEEAASAGFDRWTTGHPFPTCFVCGAERHPGDGLRIFPGKLPGREVWASGWTPDATVSDGARVRRECVWAALDCPTSAPVANFGEGAPIVLARLAARLGTPVEAGRPHVLVSWPLGVVGRKRHAASALFTDEGELRAVARALWIELKS